MKTLRALLLILTLMPIALHAQATISVSGQKVVDNNLKPLTGQLVFTVTDTTDTPITYTPQGGSPTTATFTIPTIKGAVQNIGGFPPTIANPSTMSPAGTRYRIQVQSTGGGITYFTLPLTQITQSFFSYDGYAVPSGVTATGLGLPKLPCSPHAQYNNTLASDPYPWVCSQFQGDSSVYWTQNPSLNPACSRGNDQAIASSLTGATFCIDASQAFVTPGFVWAGPSPGSHAAQIGLVPVTTLCSGGACGSGATPAAPQFAVQFAGPAAQAFNADSTFNFNPTTHGLSALLTNGGYNSDIAVTGGGNNGISNLFNGPQCSVNCKVVVPTTSTDTENAPLPPSGSMLYDQRWNAALTWNHNPGVSHANPDAFSQTCNGLMVGSCSYLQYDIGTGTGVAKQYGSVKNNLFEVPNAWNYGNAPQASNPLWMYNAGDLENTSFGSRGISQAHAASMNCYKTGDCAWLYVQQAFCDGGQPDASGEGCSGVTLDTGEEPAYLHGLVTAGATTGTTTLPLAFNPGFTPTGINRQVSSDGSYLLDISKGTIAGTITGLSAAVSGVPYIYSIPVSNTLPATTARGNMGCELPQPVPATTPVSVTCNITNIQGSTGTFTTGYAIISGDFPEGVIISAAGSSAGGTQSVTFTYLHPHGASKTMLWQGGLAGNFISYDENLAINNFREPNLHVYGAFDANHLAVEAGHFGAVTPSPYTIPFEPITMQNLVKTGTTVTATYPFSSVSTFTLYNNQPAAVIAGCSDTSLNGTVTNVVQTIGNLVQGNVMTWTQSGGGTGCPSATISLPPSFFGYHLYPGAEQRQAAKVYAVSAGGTMTLEPNNVAWAANDLVEEPHAPFFSGDIERLSHDVYNTIGQSQDTKAFAVQLNGAGISNGYVPHLETVNNPCSIYIGCGGSLAPVTWFKEGGPNAGFLNLTEAPLGINAVFTIGCQDAAIGSCGNRQQILLFSFANQLGIAQNLFYVPTEGPNGSLAGLGYDAQAGNLVGRQILAGFSGAFGAIPSATASTGDTFMSRLSANAWGFGSAVGLHDGSIEAAHGVFDTDIKVAGQNVCQTNGTNCPAPPPIASVGMNGISQPDNSTIGITSGVLSTKGFSGTCAPTTTVTVVKGVITGCS